MNVQHLIFDLDNTLYSSSADMDRGITYRMISCVAQFLHLSYDEAVKLRKEKLPGYATTLEWLRAEGLSDIEGYFAAVHPENEADELPPDPALRPLLLSLPQPKYVLTNAPREHAERVLAKLNVADLFDGICDIRDCRLNGKPYPDAYKHALEKSGGTMSNSLFLDDQYKYTDGWVALGGTAVLVGEKNGSHLQPSVAAVSAAHPAPVPVIPGCTFKIPSVYQLPDLLKRIADL